jgi:hypothetical protein
MLAICQGWNPQKLEQDEETYKVMNTSKTLQNYKLRTYTNSFLWFYNFIKKNMLGFQCEWP